MFLPLSVLGFLLKLREDDQRHVFGRNRSASAGEADREPAAVRGPDVGGAADPGRFRD